MSGLIRRICLIGLIAFDLISLVFWYLADNLFFWVFVGVNVCVIAGEVYSVITTGKTLSTNTTKALEKDDAKMRQTWIALLCFSLAMLFLVFHLVVLGK